jgi:hypothetical protein
VVLGVIDVPNRIVEDADLIGGGAIQVVLGEGVVLDDVIQVSIGVFEARDDLQQVPLAGERIEPVRVHAQALGARACRKIGGDHHTQPLQLGQRERRAQARQDAVLTPSRKTRI